MEVKINNYKNLPKSNGKYRNMWVAMIYTTVHAERKKSSICVKAITKTYF